jgi:RimJ/RimL family protein N-acetyltransferase
MSFVLRPPARPLADGMIRLRLPEPGDVGALAEYAMGPAELEGMRLPVESGASRDRLARTVDDWLQGWDGNESRNGPALLLDIDEAARFVGLVGCRVSDPTVVERVYGVARGWRSRGLATRAAILATTWLVAERHVAAVELRVSRKHRASQRVAEKAGYRLAGTVRQQVPATGEEFEDLRYIYSAEDLTNLDWTRHSGLSE